MRLKRTFELWPGVEVDCILDPVDCTVYVPMAPVCTLLGLDPVKEKAKFTEDEWGEPIHCRHKWVLTPYEACLWVGSLDVSVLDDEVRKHVLEAQTEE